MGAIRHIFVYGTLRSDFTNEFATFLRSKSTLVGLGKIAGHLYDVGSYPAAIHRPKSLKSIIGEVYQVNDMPVVLKELDAYEGYNPHFPNMNYYERVELDIKMLSGETITAYVYVYCKSVDELPLIASGDYKQHILG